jgi:hypothetical protein
MRESLKYDIEVIPVQAWELPEGVGFILFAWERKGKSQLYVTEPAEVKPSRSCFFKQRLFQTVSMVRSNGKLEAKDCAFKLQTSKGNDRKTLTKIHVNMAEFCQGPHHSEERVFALTPVGKVKCRITATLQGAPDIDAMTETSSHAPSKKGKRRSHQEGGEQDLSGFGDEGGFRRTKGFGRDSVPEEEEAAQGAAGGDEEEERRLKEERRERRRQQRLARQQADSHPGSAAPEMDVGITLRRRTWRDYLCCCLLSVETKDAPVTIEEMSLLSKQNKNSS